MPVATGAGEQRAGGGRPRCAYTRAYAPPDLALVWNCDAQPCRTSHLSFLLCRNVFTTQWPATSFVRLRHSSAHVWRPRGDREATVRRSSDAGRAKAEKACTEPLEYNRPQGVLALSCSILNIRNRNSTNARRQQRGREGSVLRGIAGPQVLSECAYFSRCEREPAAYYAHFC